MKIDKTDFDGMVILSFDDTGNQQFNGFAIVLDFDDLSILDTATFNQNEKNVLSSIVNDYFRIFGNVLFLTKDPDQLKSWYPHINDILSLKSISKKQGLNIDRYNSIYDQSFDMLKLLIKEAGI